MKVGMFWVPWRMNKMNEKFKLKKIEPIAKNSFFVVIEGPSQRDYPSYIRKKDRVYYVGVVGAYPIKLQKEMFNHVLDNIVLPHEKERVLKEFQSMLDNHALVEKEIEVFGLKGKVKAIE